MPNGGSDCCGTYWFNARNKGEAGIRSRPGPGAEFCTIRGLPIEASFWTYCANHPHRRPDRDPIPIGPVFVDEGTGRKMWHPSPDTQEVRDHLLDLVRGIEEHPAGEIEHLAGVYIESKLVVWQLGEFREERAIADLRRIAAFSPETREGSFKWLRVNLVVAAREALAKLDGLYCRIGISSGVGC
jgi:hypothetical protein